jgi:uncharacterized membrane protein
MGDWLLAMHILGALLWVGGLLVALIVLLARGASLALPERIRGHAGVFRRVFLVLWHAMPIVLLTGYGLLFGVYGGFAGVGWNVHLMHLLGLIMGGVFIWVFFGPWMAFRGGDSSAVLVIRRLLIVNLVLGLVTIVVAGLNG